jgi:hypothetical protein
MSNDLPKSNPPFPPGLTRNEFGRHVMPWGTGYEPAIARMSTITLKWLVNHQVTVEMVQRWMRFYEEVYNTNPANLSAKGRAELMRYCVALCGEQG